MITAHMDRAAAGDQVRGHVRKILKRVIEREQSEAAALVETGLTEGQRRDESKAEQHRRSR